MTIYNTTKEEPYHKETLIRFYETYNKQVKDYFKHKDNLLILNLQDTDVYSKFTDFLDFEPILDSFPWTNKT